MEINGLGLKAIHTFELSDTKPVTKSPKQLEEDTLDSSDSCMPESGIVAFLVKAWNWITHLFYQIFCCKWDSKKTTTLVQGQAKDILTRTKFDKDLKEIMSEIASIENFRKVVYFVQIENVLYKGISEDQTQFPLKSVLKEVLAKEPLPQYRMAAFVIPHRSNYLWETDMREVTILQPGGMWKELFTFPWSYSINQLVEMLEVPCKEIFSTETIHNNLNRGKTIWKLPTAPY